MTTIFHHFDNDRTAFLNPSDIIPAKPDFPDVCITTFSEKIIEQMAKLRNMAIVAQLQTANGTLPVYKTEYKGRQIAFFLSKVGAPACVAGLEEIIALGAENLVLFGCCGVLDEKAVKDNIVVPVCAVRDEGTSYHYIPASDEIYADENCVYILKQCMDDLGYPYVTGKTWTTDAIYRETRNLIRERRAQGCLVVEMESSAAYAVAQFRNIPMIQFLYGADSLDGEKWNERDLLTYGIDDCDKYVKLAFECAVRM